MGVFVILTSKLNNGIHTFMNLQRNLHRFVLHVYLYIFIIISMIEFIHTQRLYLMYVHYDFIRL